LLETSTSPKLNVNEVTSLELSQKLFAKSSATVMLPEMVAGGTPMAPQLKVQEPVKSNMTSAWATVGAVVARPAVASAARSDLSFIVYLPFHTGRLPACSRSDKHATCQDGFLVLYQWHITASQHCQW